jgi:hypothetical protein
MHQELLRGCASSLDHLSVAVTVAKRRKLRLTEAK